MAYAFTTLENHVASTVAWLTEELKSVRTGRATPTLLDGVRLEAYGSKVPLNQVATVGTEDSHTLRIIPYDKSHTKDIERAISEADLGVSTSADDKGMRVIFPSLTTDRRDQLVKIAKQKLEDARITLRKWRDETWQDIQKQEKDGLLSEDEKFNGKESMQKIIDEGNKKLEEVFEKKEKEIFDF